MSDSELTKSFTLGLNLYPIFTSQRLESSFLIEIDNHSVCEMFMWLQSVSVHVEIFCQFFSFFVSSIEMNDLMSHCTIL